MPASSLDTPIGRLTVVRRDGRIAALSWRGSARTDATPLFDDAITQLRACFAGDLKHFDPPLLPAVTPEGPAARDVMIAISFGTTATYGELAARAFGQACGAVPLPIIVPCHRVVGAGGFGHYSRGDGPATKHWPAGARGAARL